MKKRRVLALLLALSLTFGTNGMTVLATEADVPGASVTLDEGVEDAVESENSDDDQQSDDSIEDGESEGQDQSEVSGAEDNIDNPDGDNGSQNQNDGDNVENADADDDVLNGEDHVSDSEEDITSEGSEAPGEIEGESDEEMPGDADTVSEVRMMTFTDDTGMKITYDANAAQQYIYTVEDGVLTKVERSTGGDGEKEDVIFTGNVELTQPVEGEKYTSIAAGIFAGNTTITYVKLPTEITKITEGSFKGCTALKGVYLPSTVTIIEESAFETCIAMTQIAVPKTVESIGNSAFKGDARLYMVYMKDVDYSSLASIGDHAFDGCSVLSEFCSDTGFLLPESVTSIGAYAFYNCKSIAKVDLDTAELTTMGEYAFAGCTGITDAVISMSKKETVSTIPQHAFDGCTALASLTFASKVGQEVIIDEYAFYGCYSLKQLILPARIKKVADYAFAGCVNLNRIEVKNDDLIIGETQAFPVGTTKNTLLFVGAKDSTIYLYYFANQNQNVAFKETNGRDYYKYTVEDINGNVCSDGKVPGGEIWIGKPGCTSKDNKDNYDINKLNGGKGVENNDVDKYCVYLKANSDFSLVAGSVRANGEIVQPEKGYYYVTMPVGGIVITAEFRRNQSTETVEGQEVTVEFSNGEPTESGVEIKVGQTTRMFLIDGSGKPVSSSKIKEITSDAASVVKVSNAGVITALKKGTAKITVTLTGSAGIDIVITRLISVLEADVDAIKLKATTYNTMFFDISGDPDGIQTASINKNFVTNEGQSITLKANAYTSDKEGIAKELTWKSSDTKIAKVKSASTTSADASNVVEIQAGCEGEATITVTAKNAGNTDRPTVTQKFVVSVQNRTAKLAYSSIKVNPYLEEGGELEIIPSYDIKIDPTKIKWLYDQGTNSQGQTIYPQNVDFTLKYKDKADSKSYCYSVIPARNDLKEGTYKVFVCLEDGSPNESNVLPLTITVKKSAPTPTVKFNTKKTKFNIFYKNGGTDKDGNPITVTTKVTKLGAVKIKKFELEALSTKNDDRLFLDNFEIVNNSDELAQGIVTIKRKDGNLKYTSGKKAAVTGNLVIYYDGYRDEVAKKVKVTMPTVTTAPSYVLDRTSVTYRNTSLRQEETLNLLVKKTKQPVVLDKDKTQVTLTSGMSSVSKDDCTIDENGNIVFGVDYAQNGKVKFTLQSTDWDTDKNGNGRTLDYTFTVKTTNSEPIIKSNPKTVTVNLNYKEQVASFGLVSDQGDTELKSDQFFDYNHGAKNAAEYEKLAVDYSHGVGTVEIVGDNIKTGTYTWTCNPVEQDGNVLAKKVTLTVKVVNTPPTVKLGNGSLSLNLAAGTRDEQSAATMYTEKTTIPIKITGQPDGYVLDTNVNKGQECTTIVCTTKDESGKESKFDWSLEDVKKVEDKLENGKLTVSLKDSVAAKTYSFKMTLRYVNSDGNAVMAKPITVKVKVYSNSNISLTLSAKGELNLVDREGEYTAKNSIIYTPTLTNIKGTIIDAKIYDVDTEKESRFFDIHLNQENGKLYVTPKRTGDLESGYQYADLENNKSYGVKIWVNIDGYSGRDGTGGVWSNKIINVKTAQILPKVTTDKSTLNVYLSKKDYDATFVVTPKSGSAGIIESIQFGEKDEVSQDAFQIMYEKQDNGSLKVTVHLKEAVAFACNSTNNVKMYVRFKGQGTNTAGTAITMNVKINK